MARYPFDRKHFLVPTAANQIRLQPHEDIILNDGATPIRGVRQSNRSEMKYYQATDRPSPTRVNRNRGDGWRDWLFAHEVTIQQKGRGEGGQGNTNCRQPRSGEASRLLSVIRRKLEAYATFAMKKVKQKNRVAAPGGASTRFEVSRMFVEGYHGQTAAISLSSEQRFATRFCR